MDPAAQKRWITRIGFISVFLAVAVFVFFTARQPTEDDLAGRFLEKRGAFEELAAMVAQDGGALSYVTFDGQAIHDGLAPERLESYERLLRDIQALNIENLGDCGFWISAYVGGPLNRGRRFAYYRGTCSEDLGPAVTDLEKALKEARGGAGDDHLIHVAHRPLDNAWALVQQVEG